MNKPRLAIIGSGDLGFQLANLGSTCRYEVVGFYDDFATAGSRVHDFEVLGDQAQIENDFNKKKFDTLALAIGYKHMQARKEIFEKYISNIPFANLIHPSAYVDNTTHLGSGIIAYPGVTIDAFCRLEDNILLNTATTIAHDTSVGSHSFFSPRVALAGFVNIGDQCILGTNCTVIDNIGMASGTQIGAGGVVIRSIEDAGVYVGNPVRKIR